MFNNRLLCLFALAGMTSIAASPLSAYSVQGSAPALGAAIGDAITKALSVFTSGIYLDSVNEDNRASNLYDQVPVSAVSSSNGNGPVVVVLPGAYTNLEAGTLKGTIESIDQFSCRGKFFDGGVAHNFTVTYGSKTVPKAWISNAGAATFQYFDKSQFGDGETWAIDTPKAQIGPNNLIIPLLGNGCGGCGDCRYKCPVLSAPLETPIGQGYKIDGSGVWFTV